MALVPGFSFGAGSALSLSDAVGGNGVEFIPKGQLLHEITEKNECRARSGPDKVPCIRQPALHSNLSEPFRPQKTERRARGDVRFERDLHEVLATGSEGM